MKSQIVLLGTILLAGCATTVQPDLIATKAVVHIPPSSLFVCPVAPLPNSFKNNNDVAGYLVQSHSDNVQCERSLKAIQQDLENQQKVYNAK